MRMVVRDRKILWILGFVLAVILCGGALNVGDVWGVSGNCTNISRATNDSIWYACDLYYNQGKGTQGVMWISDDSSTSSVSSKVKVTDWTSGKVTAYLHGAIIGGNSARATHIKIVKGSTMIFNTAAGYKEFEPPLENVPEKMDRTGNTSPKTQNIKSSVKNIKIDISWMAKQSKSKLNYTINREGNREYSIPIQAFRCYEGNNPPSSSCYSSKSTLNIEVRILTLSGIARDVSGNRLGNNPEPDESIAPGKSGTITRKAITGYRFLGWSGSSSGAPSSMCGDSCKSYTKNNMRDDATVYAVYEKIEEEHCPVADLPSSYKNSTATNGVTSTVSKVKNDTLGEDWSALTYAKPFDKVSWGHCYFPGVQFTADTTTASGGRQVAMKNALTPWENRYTIRRNSAVIKTWSDSAGVTKVDSFIDPNYGIDVGSVGNTFTEVIETGKPIEVSVSDDGYTPSSPNGPASSSAVAIVPYNFINSTSLNVDTEETVFYAGENATVDSTINVSPKTNRYTSPNDEYATRVDGAKRKLELCYDGSCKDVAAQNGVLNSSGNMSGETTDVKFTFAVPDMPAGTKVCMRSGVYPKDSGPDTNTRSSYYNANNRESWAWSDPEICFYIAKRPSIQVWGGNVYSAGAIKTGRSVKQVLHNSNDERKPYVFGSWGELGVISAGSVSGFASGASIGYLNNGGVAWPAYAGNPDEELIGSSYPGGGTGSSDFCRYSVLTFPNSNCASGSAGGSSSNTVKSIDDNKDALKALVGAGMGNRKRDAYDAEFIDGFNDDGKTWIVKTSGELVVTGGVLARDTFKLLSADNGIVINGDIKVRDDVLLENFDQAPKVVLYSRRDIKINCDVKRLDAILIAEGDVVTCDSDEDINSAIYSRQLIVNGAIIASKLNANRTYGAARGINSIVSAEIINFDPTLYLWGGAAGGTGSNSQVGGDLVTTYVHDLAPRY